MADTIEAVPGTDYLVDGEALDIDHQVHSNNMDSKSQN